MPKIELPPTKSSLRKLKEDLSFAYEGYDLLNQKREILAIEIVRQIGEIRRVEAEFLGVADELYSAYRIAAIDMGSEVVTLKSSSEKRRYFLQMESVRLMGLKLPKIRISIKKPRLVSSLTGTTATYDRAKEQSTKVLEVLADYASITKSIILLSRELKKVQRKVNALEKIFIPQHEEAKKYIADRLEEMERDEVFVKKLIRQRASGGKDNL
jgi:V/A-type H+-transporting ATPase subunit D